MNFYHDGSYRYINSITFYKYFTVIPYMIAITTKLLFANFCILTSHDDKLFL